MAVIRSFFAHLPAEVDLGTRDAAEADLTGKAGRYRPDELVRGEITCPTVVSGVSERGLLSEAGDSIRAWVRAVVR